MQYSKTFQAVAFFFLSLTLSSSSLAGPRPNVILVITDDQGYGDVGAHGNPLLKTPNLDQLYRQSVRLTNFHVDPTCSPTRSALMSGRYSTKTGVWHTICGRSLMSPDELTLGEIFLASGYRTAMFGKWHLGDAYPLRPQDQGFELAVYHGGGGVGQTPDYWGNDYFDDTYWRNGEPEQFDGYCTDVWFGEAMQFIRTQRDKPFFVYLSTNAPHGPYLVDESYSKPYASAGNPADKFLGMIANIDENMGRLMQVLRDLELEQDTILIFMTDNGTASGEQVFNAGMRGKKGSEYEGGHRVPFFVRWPGGGLVGGRDADQLTAHIDVRPTLVELCNLTEPEGPKSDGKSLVPILRGDTAALRDRTVLVHSQRILHCEKWRKSSVMTDRWRLVNGKELYDVRQDPGQKDDVAAKHPHAVEQLRAGYESWWSDLLPAMSRTVHMTIGSEHEPRTRLTAHDWLRDGSTPWNQGAIRRGEWTNGPWALDVAEAGEYEIAISRWPEHTEKPLEATEARITIQDNDLSKPVDAEDHQALFRVRLQPGKTRLQTYLTNSEGKQRGAYYAYIRRVSE